MSEQLIYEILGEKYILVEEAIQNSRQQDILNKKAKLYGCISQGIKIDRGGWFENSVVIAKILVPERNILKYNNHE